MDMQNLCLICEEELSQGETVTVTRGLKTIINSSMRRKDEIAEKLEGLSSICVHVMCRKSYTRESNIAAAINPSPRKVKTLRSSLLPFNFKLHCLFCGDECDLSAEKKPLDRRNIYEIRTTTCKQSIYSTSVARDDEWGHMVGARIEGVIDLVAAEAKYHNSCYVKFFKMPSNRKRGRPKDDDLAAAFDDLFAFLKENDECQYSVEELHEKLGEYLPACTSVCSEKTMRKKLVDHFGDDVIITSLHGRKPVVCFRDTGFKIINSSWYTQKSQDPAEERLRIVKTAAAIIREDIRSMAYITDAYAPADTAFDDTASVIPHTLNVFMDDVINKRKKGDDKGRKCAVINHAIISATRPRSFLSMIQVGLALYIHRHVGSRHLVDILFSMGICASYNEARLYEASAMLQKQPLIHHDSFKQFVFDNADFNVRTMEGYGTFHSMGGIMCVTPGNSVELADVTERLKKQPPAERSAHMAVKLLTYSARNTRGIHGITVKDLNDITNLASFSPVNTLLDMLWVCGSWLKVCINPSWSGYMEMVTKNSKDYQISRVIVLPFVNLQPTSLDAIYTVLMFAADKCKRQGQQTCVVTFDQPLYTKATDMVAAADSDSELSSVVVRLGGFHLLMSFMGAVGYIMGGSGLKELWSLIYATDSTDKMLMGHAYARALRAHFLTQLAVAVVTLRDLDIEEPVRVQIGSLHEAVMNGTVSAEDVTKCPALATVMKEMETLMFQASITSRTAKLWVQYFNQVKLMHQFLRAERSGDWTLHLETIREMIPHFHAAGHLAYAKCAHLYLQQMSELDDKMTPEEFQKFSALGNFTVRRSDKLWAGVWTDMTIEQVLMRAMKTSGGLTRGRGMTDSVLNRWVLGMPGCTELGLRFEEFCGTNFTTSEQHVELRKSRQLRDNKDVDKLTEWMTIHPPLTKCHELMSISTGVVGNETINCDEAIKIGTEAMKKTVGTTFGDIKLHRKDRILPLSAMSNSVKVREEIMPVNTMQLFNRIICVVKSDEDFASCLQYELAPRPLSLFDEISMRKTEKAVMYKVIESLTECEQTYPQDSTFVIDGGYLLRRVVWPQQGLYSDLYRAYVSYVQRHFTTNCSVVFDGYSDAPSTKSVEQKRRAMKFQSTEILFTDEMPLTIRQDRFLANGKNKARFIQALTDHMEQAGISVRQAVADADALIVHTAIERSHNNNVVVVGTDVDLLILLTELAQPDNSLYLFKAGSGKYPNKVYNIKSVQCCLPNLCNNLFFLHAMTGCDTTSALYRQGKKKAFNLLRKRPDLQKCAEVFNKSSSSEGSVTSAGEEFLLALYGAPKTTLSLNQHRHHRFMKAVAKCPSHSKIQLAALPPTSAAAKEHSLRVYHQVQHWLGYDLPQTDWGWDLVNGNLHPVLTRQPPAPDSLLNLISCNCKCGCERGCGCKKAGLKCSLLCGNCRGSGCSNSETPEEVSDDDGDDHTNVLQHENEDPSDLTQSDDSSDEDGIDLQEEDSSDSDDHSEVASAFSSTSTDRVKKTRKRKLTSE